MAERKATPPNLLSQPNVDLFRKDDFEATIWLKGYDVKIEHAVTCPCRGNSGAAKPTCMNCLGTGWIFINPLMTKAIISSINKQTKYQHWSPEFVGTISITVRDLERLNYMDKITFETRLSSMSEVKQILVNGLQKFVFCSYPVERVINVFLFDGDENKLVKLDKSEYSINSSNKLVVKINAAAYPDNFNGVVSIEYEHKVGYNVVDIPHDFRSTFIVNERGQNVEYNMPMNAIAQKSHILIGAPTNYGGNNLVNNDTL